MTNRSPLGNNYGWVVNTDRHYFPRDLNEELHSVLAISAVVQDPELSKIEKVLGYPVILAVKLGTNTITVRVYNRKEVEARPDNLSSRGSVRDDSAFMVFNASGGVTLLEGLLRDMAQGHIPTFYADRVLSPRQVQALDGLQAQFTGNAPRKLGLPQAAAPLDDEGEWADNEEPQPPSLEPTNPTPR